MKFPVKHTADFAIVPAGNHVAICIAVVDLGLQPGSRQYPDPKPQVYLRFELPQEQIEYTRDGEKLTPLQALRKYGCMRLAARIKDLRDAGHDINTTLIRTQGARVARYSL